MPEGQDIRRPERPYVVEMPDDPGLGSDSPPAVATLEALRDAAETISSAKTLESLFDVIGEQVARVVEYHSLRLFLLDEDERELYPAAVCTTVEEYTEVELDRPELRMKLGEGVTGLIGETRTAEVIYDLASHPAVYYPPGIGAVPEESVIGVPLVFRDELIGVITLSREGTFEFDGHQLALMEVLAVPIAGAIAHRRADDAERRARRQEERLRDLHSSFVSNISHELRTPVTTALGFLDIAISRPEETEGLPDLLARARDGIERLRILIERLLEAVAIESNRQQLDLAPHRAHDLLRSAREAAHVPAARLDIEGDLDAVIVVDRVRITSVIAELIENADKYGPDGGRIAVVARDLNERFEVEVGDEGEGIGDEDAEVIFERFVQNDPSLTRSRGGTGIGLSLARSIVRWHGGDLEALPGAPTRFRMALPQAPRANGPAVDEDPVSPPARR